MKSLLHENGTEMYSTDNERKLVVAERFIRALKNKIYKHMWAVSKNVYLNNLEEIINKYNNIHHRTIKMKSADINSDTSIYYGAELNDQDSKFKIGYHVRISKNKNILWRATH